MNWPAHDDVIIARMSSTPPRCRLNRAFSESSSTVCCSIEKRVEGEGGEREREREMKMERKRERDRWGIALLPAKMVMQRVETTWIKHRILACL